MALIRISRRIPDDELRASADETLPQLEEWFTNNPKRRICRAELWYGKYHVIRRKDVKTQIDKIVEGLLSEKK